MAEILGIVIGGVSIASFAVQIDDNALKLKNFWNAVKDAPDEVKYVIEEIGTIM